MIPITTIVQKAIDSILTATPGSAFSVHIPVGHGSTQAMIFACCEAVRPMIIARQHTFVQRELTKMQIEQRGTPVSAVLPVPYFVTILHPISVTLLVLNNRWPDLIILMNGPGGESSRWMKALETHRRENKNTTVVTLVHGSERRAT